MANLKHLKLRIKSVKSTQKITKAMKMVAASKLRQAKLKAEESMPYATGLKRLLKTLTVNIAGDGISLPLLFGTGKDTTHLLIVVASDRGLCGAFNGNIIKATKKKVKELELSGHEVKILCIGRKSYDQLKHIYKKKILDKIEGVGRKNLSYKEANLITSKVLHYFNNGEFNVCSIIYNKFKSAISQVVTIEQLIPLDRNSLDGNVTTSNSLNYEYEQSEESLLAELMPKNLAAQVYHALLESAASEQGARMSAMDNATRSAGEMINALTLEYNRTRQAAITKELIEIISGAEAI